MKKIRTLTVAAALSSAILPTLVLAQASAPAPLGASAASAPLPVGPRLLTPAEKRNSAGASAIPELRSERPVVPQISVPLGRTPPVPGPSPASSPRRGAAAPPGHVGDAAARCESLPGDMERATCRKRLAETKPPA